MEDLYTYNIEIRGPVDQDEVNATSPVKIKAAQAAEHCTVLSACTDQSGLIGLMRHLHGLGYILLSFKAQAPDPAENMNRNIRQV